MKQALITISGKVQGVWFRASTEEKALELKLTGHVKNTPDGCVEILAQGSEEAINELLKWCAVGPEAAEPSDVKVEWQKADAP